MAGASERYLRSDVSDAMVSYKDGGKIRWKVCWLKGGGTAMASEWVNDDKYGREWVKEMVAKVNAERRAAGVA